MKELLSVVKERAVLLLACLDNKKARKHTLDQKVEFRYCFAYKGKLKNIILCIIYSFELETFFLPAHWSC